MAIIVQIFVDENIRYSSFRGNTSFDGRSTRNTSVNPYFAVGVFKHQKKW
jgi:hypothetical protein